MSRIWMNVSLYITSTYQWFWSAFLFLGEKGDRGQVGPQGRQGFSGRNGLDGSFGSPGDPGPQVSQTPQGSSEKQQDAHLGRSSDWHIFNILSPQMSIIKKYHPSISLDGNETPLRNADSPRNDHICLQYQNNPLRTFWQNHQDGVCLS